MKILHLTDLHLTRLSREHVGTLTGVWDDAQVALPTRLEKFDFVVITGDLTQSAKEKEYTELQEFLNVLVKRVEGQDRSRIVMVPGNHDVDWEAVCGPKIWTTMLQFSRDLRTEFKKSLGDLAGSRLRWQLNDRGALALHRIAPEQYAQRFARCQSFLDRYYKDITPPDDRRFVLTASDPKKHWSAHLFPRDHVAFYGFNSCHCNDKYWKGAEIALPALEEAKKHANEHAPLEKGWTRVALWHHGVRSERGDPDLLTTRNLEQLALLQPALGMHGHTHEEGIAELRDKVHTPFPVVGAGSFIVSADQRPEGIANGFSVVELTRSLIRWERYHRHKNGTWNAPAAPDEVIFSRIPKLERLPQRDHVVPRIGTHRRVAEVDDDGIAAITVSLEDAHLDADLPLAHVHTPFNSCDADTFAKAGTAGEQRVHREERDNGEVWHSLVRPEDVSKETSYSTIDWTYRIANSFKLSRRDVAACEGLDQSSGSLRGYDYFAHFVRFQTNALVLELKLPEKLIESVVARAERRELGESISWVPDARESKAITVAPFTGVTDRVSITVRQPVLNYRYALYYKLVSSENDRAIRPDAQHAVNQVSERCRSHLDGGRTRDVFIEAMRNAIYAALDRPPDQPDDPVSWLAYLWHPQERHLLPVFGDCPLEQWSGRFGYGQGLVGHSFRKHGATVYYKHGGRAPKDKGSLLLLEAARARRLGIWLYEHSWIVCVPILNRRDNTAVGVVSFSSFPSEPNAGTSAALKQIAATAVTMSRTRIADRVDALIQQLSIAFWSTVQHLELGEGKDLAFPPIAPRERERGAVRARRQERRLADGQVTLKCADHGPVVMKRVDSSHDGLGLIGAPCECARENATFDIDVDGSRKRGVVRHRGSDGSLGILLQRTSSSLS